MKSEGVSLTTNELASVLALCGYETMASQILNSINLKESTDVFERFIKDTELSLKGKGFWDESRSTMLVSGLEDLMHILVQSKRKIRCIKEDRVLFIHLLKGDQRTLIQEIRNHTHLFSIHSMENGFQSILLGHFELDRKSEKTIEEIPTLQLSETIYDQLHQIEPLVIDSMIKDEKLAGPLRLFLSDFKSNQQEFDNVSLMEMDYVKDYAEIKEVIFLLPSENFVWHLDYHKIHEKEIYVVPTSIDEYSKKLNEAISLFFDE